MAAERDYHSASTKADLARLGFGRAQQLAPALVIPICSVRSATESYQLHPDTPRLNKKGHPRKYEMKAGTRMLVDVHPRLTRRNGKAPSSPIRPFHYSSPRAFRRATLAYL